MPISRAFDMLRKLFRMNLMYPAFSSYPIAFLDVIKMGDKSPVVQLCRFCKLVCIISVYYYKFGI